MKTKILFLIIAFSGMLFLSGCEDTLDVTENFIYELEVKVFLKVMHTIGVCGGENNLLISTTKKFRDL
jgi:hypothetical protein